MSPERLRGEVHGAASDVWSVGVTLAEFATGHHPFVGAAAATTEGSASADRFWAMAAAIRHTGTDDECEEATNAAVEKATVSCGLQLRSFLRAALRAHPKDRASVSQLLQHPFIVSLAPAATTADGGVAGPWFRSSAPGGGDPCRPHE
jgi:serine/threonine protein kinase